tara:strand:+ start:619 stop:1104 length:486 start_codon:yes stop_codon:yes gene_type:complete
MAFIGKKGVSPLIATIILVVFAVTLASVVINWGFNIELDSEPSNCKSVRFTMRSTGSSDVCLTSNKGKGYLNFIIDNTGTTEITGFDIWMIGNSGTKLSSLDNLKIEPSTLLFYKENTTEYDNVKYGSIKQVHLIPKIGSSTATVCPKKVVKAKTPSLCKT